MIHLGSGVVTYCIARGERYKCRPKLKNGVCGDPWGLIQACSQIRRLGDGQNFRGNSYYFLLVGLSIAYTQLTVAIIIRGATVLRVGYKTMLWAKRAENILVCIPIVTFWGTPLIGRSAWWVWCTGLHGKHVPASSVERRSSFLSAVP